MQRRSIPLAFAICAAAGWLALFVPAVRADCALAGECAAIANPDDPALGDWKYRLHLTWDTGTEVGVDHFDLLLNLGIARMRLGRLGDAEAPLLRATGIAPGDARTWAALGAWYGNAGRPDDARHAFGRSMRPVRGAKSVIHINIRQRSQLLCEFRVILLLGLVETKVFKQDDFFFRTANRLLNSRPDAIVKIKHLLFEKL